MIIARKPANEGLRLRTLRSLELLDTEPEETFDALNLLAANLCGVPMAAVTLLDADRQWFKSHHGLGEVTQTHRDVSFCAHAILQTGVFEVCNAHEDVRFADNPLVTGAPGIRFYAGAPLIYADGLELGMLCVMDRKPGRLNDIQKDQLTRLSRAVVEIIAMRIRRSQRDACRQTVAFHAKAHAELRQRSDLLRSIAHPGKSGVLRHTLPSRRRHHGAPR